MNAPAPFTPAHKVVIDAMTFLAAMVQIDERFPLIIDALDRALPDAHGTGYPQLDSMILAAASVAGAARARRQNRPDWGSEWALAMLGCSAAVREFAWWRLGQSYDAFSPQPQELADA